MKVSLPFKRTGFEPEVVAQLEALRDFPLDHEQRGWHHPIDIFAIASQEFWDNLDDLLVFLDEVSTQRLYRRNGDRKWARRLIKELDHVLDAIVQFLDACQAIIKCCCSDDPSKKKQVKALRHFNDAVEPLFKRIKHSVNWIKHEHRTLQIVVFFNDNLYVPGYFVEGVVAPRIAGPDAAIHSKANTAFSFARDLRIFVCSYYLASAALAQEIRWATSQSSDDSYKPRPLQDAKIMAILEKISRFPLEFFPDEVAKGVPWVHFKPSAIPADATALLEFPKSGKNPKTISEACEVSTSWTVRSVANSFRPPYMQGGEESVKSVTKAADQ